MHPNAFLKTFWQGKLRPDIFVAMSFDSRYKDRYEKIIEPAIRAISVGGISLEPRRVDLSKSGDSILTEIVDGIAHSQMVLADVSIIGKDSVTSIPYRNGNVMYEVGIALACRQSSEVLLIRDDKDKILFDVSTVPHMTLDFTDIGNAFLDLNRELTARLRERNLVNDARVETAIAALSSDELRALKEFLKYAPGTVWGRKSGDHVDFFGMAAFPRLVDKQLIKVVGEFDDGSAAYHWTDIGTAVANKLRGGLRIFAMDKPKDAKGLTPAEPLEPLA